VEVGLSTSGVYELVHDGNKDDDEEGVEVGYDVVGDTAELHGGGLGGQVVGHLTVGKPVQRVPEENLTGDQTSTDFINPGIIESHPCWLVGTKVRWLGDIPESGSLDVSAESDGIQ